MITSLLEFYFSKHYFYDSDNRYKLRIKDAIIKNELNDMSKAKLRFNQVMTYLGLEKLDNLSTNGTNVAIILGNIYFKENNKIVKADIEVDKNAGNVYVVIIKDETVVTILLLPDFLSNKDILDKCNNDPSSNKGDKLEKIIDIKGNNLDLNSKKRDNIIIDLDEEYSEFSLKWPIAQLKNNPWSKSAFSKIELDDIERKNIERKNKENDNKELFSPTIIPDDLKSSIPNKEFVIYQGKKILVNINGEIKFKTIRKLIVNEKSNIRTFSLEFENTLKPFDLKKDSIFIINPEMKNDEYIKLLNAFKLEEGNDLAFIGPIQSFNYYKKGKGGSEFDKIGIIISPRQFLTVPSK